VDHTEKPPTVLSFCTGYGGIELGLERVFGAIATIAHVEIEAYAVGNLVAKMEAGELVPAPVWTDIKTFPAHLFRGHVDGITAGYPCQPFAFSGKRGGEDDPRHLWPFIRDHVRVIQPFWCFFENVEGHITLGLSRVISDLEELGYLATWGLFSAAEVGAPHQRKRVFILAYNRGAGRGEIQSEQRRTECGMSVCDGEAWGTVELGHTESHDERRACEPAEHGQRITSGRSGVSTVANSESSGKLRRPAEVSSENGEARERHEDTESDNSGAMADTMHSSGAFESRRRREEIAVTGVGEILPDPVCSEPQGTGRTRGRRHEFTDFCLWPAGAGQEQYEWEEPRTIMADTVHAVRLGESRRQCSCGHERGQGASGNACECISARGNAEPELGGADHGASGRVDAVANRVDRLRLCGNGVVPQTAEKAFRTLRARFDLRGVM